MYITTHTTKCTIDFQSFFCNKLAIKLTPSKQYPMKFNYHIITANEVSIIFIKTMFKKKDIPTNKICTSILSHTCPEIIIFSIGKAPC